MDAHYAFDIRFDFFIHLLPKLFSESQLTGKIFQNYRVSLEQSSIQASGSKELFISVFKNDLPITKLLLKHEGNLEEFLVMDIDKDESLEII